MFHVAPGQGWLQVGELMLAFLLSSAVGFEREMRQKTAGLRTYALVGVAAALFTLVSKYGFMDVLDQGRVVLDPSRVAAQLVSGIGFIGGGVIFMRRDVVRGLTTAASVWLTAALGCACGAGLVLLAIATVAIHFTVMLGFPILARRMPRPGIERVGVFVTYVDGRGLLRHILVACTRLGLTIADVRIERGLDSSVTQDKADAAIIDQRLVTVALHLSGPRPLEDVVTALNGIDGVMSVSTEQAVETE